MIRKEQLYEQILEQIDLTKETDDEELQELIRTVLDEAADEEYISLSDKIRIGRELFNSFRKLDVLQELLEDDSITEIMVNGIDHIFYEKEGRIFRSKKCFLSQERYAVLRFQFSKQFAKFAPADMKQFPIGKYRRHALYLQGIHFILIQRTVNHFMCNGRIQCGHCIQCLDYIRTVGTSQ